MPNLSVTYEPVSFAALPGWDIENPAGAISAFRLSCRRIVRPERKSRVTLPPETTLEALERTCKAAEALPASISASDARRFFEREFVPYAVKHNGPEGLVTGYYEPVLEGSRSADSQYRFPVHRRPADLINLVDETERGAKNGALTHARLTPSGTVPYATRADIEAGALAGRGLEIAYLADPVDKFFMQIQGSGQIRLPDGTTIRLAYDGKNGHPYTSVGRYLIDQNVIGADRMSLDALGAWLRDAGERGREVMRLNKSYVFFREMPASQNLGPIGALDIPLTEGRSLAIDTAYHPLGLPVYVTAPTLTHASPAGGFNRLMISQDVGSAIKGPERGDIYFGSGSEAGKRAGVTKHPAHFTILLPAVISLKPAQLR
jgi:membrane-bound lytic murein transglycosylase A